MQPEDLPASAVTYLPVLTRPETSPLPYQLRSERVRVREFEEHVEALDGAALDPLHLLLRSSLEPKTLKSEETLALAAVLKAEHDLALLTSQGNRMDPGWASPLHEDLARLMDHRPLHRSLKQAWHGAVMALERTLAPAALAA